MDRRGIFGLLAATVVATPATALSTSAACENKHRLVLHVDQGDINKMNLALGNTSNVAQHYKSLGDDVEIEIVSYSQGLHMLREDTSPVKERIRMQREQVRTVVFSACDNT